MACLGMALLAELGRTSLQQRLKIRTVTGMAEGTVLCRGLVFPEKRAAFLGMAACALLTLRGSNHQAAAIFTVCVMALAAGHLPFTHRMVGGLKELRLLIDVAAETDPRLIRSIHHRVPRAMDLMAGSAGDFIELMCGTLPFDTLMVLMAGQAAFVLMLHRGPGLSAEVDDWWFGFALFGVDLMITTCSVTGLALLVCKGSASVGGDGMLGFEQRKDRVIVVFVVAFQTGVRSFLRRFCFEYELYGLFSFLQAHAGFGFGRLPGYIYIAGCFEQW